MLFPHRSFEETAKRELKEETGITKEDIKLIHYNFAYKPWHFEDIKYNEYFLKYAKETEFYEEIVKIRESYTEEQKFRDREAEKGLEELAIRENSCVGDDRENRRM